ncbi:tyrosine-sulfated glycopeptide receptor 1 isoform X1 [Pyrus x bretschneideri]|uniref:tyrosine-sulfated glycopeptide receptor 1 isoform X1 n=1 Tax=Pyrus x bretschneideri TaxID=225117 RepID=UPI00202FE9F9|nr:tyrosine-sulfated glycopeptide receptor 1 isoform X1 [Pyrus x bretschneideri]
MVHGFLLVFLFSFIISTTNIHASNQTECTSLMAFALTLSSPLVNWSSFVDCCHWKGITCNQDGRVTHLLLPSNGLKGGMSVSSLSNLTHLTHLNLSHNSLYGALETQFFLSLNHLEILDLSYNLLSGEMPFSLPPKNIQTIDLSSNHFHGAISTSFFQQAWNLTSFNVSNNTFSGYIPSSIYLRSSSSIRVLDFSSNEFSGNISGGLGGCSKLQILRVGHNNLSGSLPEDIYNATKLEELALPLNSLNGAISARIANLTHLTILDLYFNYLSGTIPLNFGKLSKLKYMALDFNSLEGAMKILIRCKSLHVLLLTSSFDSEAMPTDDDMVDFHGFQNLRMLSLANCSLTGHIPGWLSNLKNLSMLFLAFNQITGLIPSWLGTLPKLFVVDLSHNQISGEFQKQLCRLPMLMTNASRLDNYEFELPLLGRSKENPSFWPRRLPFYQGMINLAANNICGVIPIEIGQLQLLRELHLNGNNFFGEIPDQISKLKYLELLNLSTNHLSGELPLSITSLNFLKEFDVSYNNLKGKIPTGTQLQSFDASAFEGNLQLCGAPLPNECKDIDADNKNNVDQDADNECDELPWFYIFVALGFIVGFWGSLWFFCS